MSRGNAGRKRVTFRIQADTGSEVLVMGSFDCWTKGRALKPGPNGVYQGILLLPPGRHEYKFRINGEWHIDPSCGAWVTNALGTLNNVIEVN